MVLKGKIIAFAIAVVTALTPMSRMDCGHRVCHVQEDSTSMPCHATHGHALGGAIEGAPDHSCCHVFPAVPSPVRAQATALTAQPQTYLPVSETFKGRETFSQSFGSLSAISPPRSPQQSHSCVLQI